MALQTQLVDLILGQGVDQSAARPQFDGHLASLINGRFQKVGSIVTRPGFTERDMAVMPSGDLTGAYKLLSRDTELIKVGTSRIGSRSDIEDEWRDVDDIPEFTIAERMAGEHGYIAWGDTARFDYAYASGVHVLSVGSPVDLKIHVRVIDSVTGMRYPLAVFEDPYLRHHRLLYINNKIWLIYGYSAGGMVGIRGSCLDTTAPSAGWSTPVTLVADYVLGPWDACVTGTSASDHILIVSYHSATPGHLATKVRHDGVVLTVSSVLTGIPINTMAVAGTTNGYAWVAYDTTVGMRCEVLDEATFSVYTGAITVDASTYTGGTSYAWNTCLARTPGANTAALLYSVGPAAAEGSWRVAGVLMSAGGSFLGHHQTWGYALASRNTYSMGQHYALYHKGEVRSANAYEQPFAVLCEPLYLAVDPGVDYPFGAGAIARPVCRVAVSLLGNAAGLSSLVLAGAELICAVPMAEVNHQIGGGSTLRSVVGADMYRFVRNDGSAMRDTAIAAEIALSGGIPSIYDGQQMADIGFPTPRIKSVASNAGSLTGTYYYYAVYSRRDSRGVVQRSAPSEAYKFVASTDNPIVTVTTCTLSQGQDLEDQSNPIQVEIYRTLAGGSKPYYVGSTWNNVHVETVSVTDALADLGASTSAVLYTFGGVFSNSLPPCAKDIVYHNSRLWLISGDEPDKVWLSKIHMQGEIPGWNELLTFTVGQGSEPLIAIADLGDKIALFKENAIYVCWGDGPSDTNAGADLTPPQLLSTDVGCIDARSVVQCQAGVAFRASSGYWLLTRGQELKPIGTAIQDLIASATIYDAQASNEHNEIWLCATRTSTAGDVHVYNWRLGQWSTWQIPVGAIADYAMVGMRLVNGTINALGANGVVYAENTTGFDPDGFTYPKMTIATQWIRAQSLQGWQRVRRVTFLFDRVATTGLTFSEYLGYSATAAATKTYTPVQVTAMMLRAPAVQAQWHLPSGCQKSDAIQIKVEATGRIEAHALTFELGVLNGWMKLGSTSRGS